MMPRCLNIQKEFEGFKDLLTRSDDRCEYVDRALLYTSCTCGSKVCLSGM
jgi:hypothetical protein